MSHRLPRLLTALALALALVAGGALSVTSAEARTRPRPERRASLQWVLAAHDTELDKGVLDALGPDTDELLIDIANTPRETPRVRVRALAGLAFYPSEGTFGFLSSLLHERNFIGNAEGLQLRRQAIRSLGRGFGERAIDDLVALRTDPEPGIRQAVAAGLGDAGSARALPVLELWLSTEHDLVVREAVDRAVNRLRNR